MLRLKKKVHFYTIKEEVLDEPNIISIKTIQLNGPNSEQYAEHLKSITLHDTKTGKNIEVITNNFELTAKEISEIYRKRWDIELFFRWLKQNLQVKRFYGRNENAMKSQIWIAMIVYLLLYNLHRFSEPKEKFIDFIRKFKSRLFQADPIVKKTYHSQAWISPEFEPSG